MHHISKNWEHVFDFQYKVVTGRCDPSKVQHSYIQVAMVYWLEHPVHNFKVPGSNPAAVINFLSLISLLQYLIINIIMLQVRAYSKPRPYTPLYQLAHCASAFFLFPISLCKNILVQIKFNEKSLKKLKKT